MGRAERPSPYPEGLRPMSRERFVRRMLADAERRALIESDPRGEEDPYGEEIPAEILRVAGERALKGEADG